MTSNVFAPNAEGVPYVALMTLQSEGLVQDRSSIKKVWYMFLGVLSRGFDIHLWAIHFFAEGPIKCGLASLQLL